VRWLRAREFTGVVGMEHGNATEGQAGEDRLIAAYREIDRG
jgi:hydroxypyruvate isomerase